MLNHTDAKAIAARVAADPEASKRINSNIDAVIPASWGMAGGLRNAGYVVLGMATGYRMGDPTEPEYANRVCTGISDAAVAAINAGVNSRLAPLRRVRQALQVDRDLDGTAHTAVRVEMIDGQCHVFDWHATLDADNPMLFKSVAGWLAGRGGTPLDDFKGFD